jgi:hypothetical protein
MVMDVRGAEDCWTFKLCPTGVGSRASEVRAAGDQDASVVPPGFSLEVSRYPARPGKKARELAALLGLELIRETAEYPSFAEDNRDWTLRSLNKEV